MIRSRLIRTSALIVVASAMWAAIPGSAATPADQIGSAATGGAPAVNVSKLGDLVSIYNFGPLQPAVVGRGFGIGLVQVTRGGVPIHQAPAPVGSWYFPTSITALPLDSIGAVLGRNVSKYIAAGQVVMGATSASLSGAQAGDAVDLVA
ncbi:MAG: hypothetical protein ABIZ69_10160, partial [Ilumatobacteraceae bacterium]